MSDSDEEERVELDYSEIEEAIIHSDMNSFTKKIDSADINQRSENGETLLHTTAVLGEPEMAELLIERGIDLSPQGSEEKTPLHLALESNNQEVAKLLIEHGANLSVEDIYGNQPLWPAVFKGNIEMSELLVEHGADPTHTNENGKSPLSLAKEYGIEELIKALESE